MPSIRPIVHALVVGFLLGGSVQGQSAPAGSIAGFWKLNVELSDRMEEKLRDALRAGAYYGAAGRGSRSGGPATRQGDAITEERELAAMIAPTLQLQILQDGNTATISDAGGQMQPLATDGSKTKESLLSGASLETQARWKDSRLTIERKQEKLGTVREVYFVDRDSRKLILEIRLTSHRLPRALEFRRVYDPAPGT